MLEKLTDEEFFGLQNRLSEMPLHTGKMDASRFDEAKRRLVMRIRKTGALARFNEEGKGDNI